ncbi:MAG: hypothetical protein GQ527_02380 [Bacteroidales bacterium]|nr:hypothetical protein [Bacteroidales bacterium]
MKYLYYKLWQQFKRVKTNDMSATNAMIFLTIWQGLNLFFAFIIIKLYFIDISFRFGNSKYIIATVLFSILTSINYFFLYKNRDKLVEKYKNETGKKKKLGNLLLIIYIFLSFALLLYFGQKLNP